MARGKNMHQVSNLGLSKRQSDPKWCIVKYSLLKIDIILATTSTSITNYRICAYPLFSISANRTS